MKKLLTLAIIGATAVGAFAQGVIGINTAGANAYVRFSNTVASAWASGNSYMMGVYWADSAATLSGGGGTLIANGGTNGTGLAIFTSGVGAGYVAASTFGGNRTISERAGAPIFVQLRAWSAGYSSWTEAGASGLGNVLWTQNGPITSATPTATSSTPVSPVLWAPGSSSSNPFVVSLVPVPEPSVIALGVLGLAGALFIRRRK